MVVAHLIASASGARTEKWLRDSISGRDRRDIFPRCLEVVAKANSAQLTSAPSARQRRPSCRLLATAVPVASEPEPGSGPGPGPDVLSDFVVRSPRLLTSYSTGI